MPANGRDLARVDHHIGDSLGAHQRRDAIRDIALRNAVEGKCLPRLKPHRLRIEPHTVKADPRMGRAALLLRQRAPFARGLCHRLPQGLHGGVKPPARHLMDAARLCQTFEQFKRWRIQPPCPVEPH